MRMRNIILPFIMAVIVAVIAILIIEIFKIDKQNANKIKKMIHYENTK